MWGFERDSYIDIFFILKGKNIFKLRNKFNFYGKIWFIYGNNIFLRFIFIEFFIF